MSVTKNISISFITRIITFLTAFITSIIVSRYLGPEKFGIYKYIVILVTTSYAFTNLGVFESINQSLASKKINCKLAFIFNTLWAFVLLLLGLALGYTVFTFFPEFNVDKSLLFLTISYLFLYILNFSIKNVLIGMHMINQHNILDMLKVISIFLATLFLLLTDAISLKNLLLVQIYIIALHYLVAFKFISSEIFSVLKSEPLTLSQIDKIIKRSLIVFISNISAFLNYRADMFFLKYFSSFKSIGIYSIAVGLVEKIWILPESIRTIVYLEIASNRKDKKFVSKVLRLLTFVLFIITFIIAISAKKLVPLLYSERYLEAVIPVLILLPGIFFFSYSKILGSYFFAVDKTKFNTLSSMISFLSNILLNIFMIPKFGISGAAISTTISYSLGSFIHIYFFKKESDEKIWDMIIINRDDLKLIFDKIRRR